MRMSTTNFRRGRFNFGHFFSELDFVGFSATPKHILDFNPLLLKLCGYARIKKERHAGFLNACLPRNVWSQIDQNFLSPALFLWECAHNYIHSTNSLFHTCRAYNTMQPMQACSWNLCYQNLLSCTSVIYGSRIALQKRDIHACAF
jgi:hypothetical protein